VESTRTVILRASGVAAPQRATASGTIRAKMPPARRSRPPPAPSQHGAAREDGAYLHLDGKYFRLLDEGANA
jgi:hypothetical protein